MNRFPIVEGTTTIFSNLFCFFVSNNNSEIMENGTNPTDVSGTSTATSTTANAYRAVIVVDFHGSIH